MGRTLIIMLIPVLLLTACSPTDGGSEDIQTKTDEIDDYLQNVWPDIMFGGGEPVIYTPDGFANVRIRTDLYTLYEVEQGDERYNKDDFLFIGEVTENGDISSNYLPFGTKIFRINGLSLYVEYVHSDNEYRAVAEMLVDSVPPLCVFLDGKLFLTYQNEDDRDKQDTSKLEYIGDIVFNTANLPITRGRKLTPEKEFEAYGLPEGTKIYRIDEENIYLEYEAQELPESNIYAIGAIHQE
ncbi:MAG: hypothetical protein FWH17_01720 [Oscillospiraceae bacterium]|nr:hypothetical protein [Oscillospiraceae bacterium]